MIYLGSFIKNKVINILTGCLFSLSVADKTRTSNRKLARAIGRRAGPRVLQNILLVKKGRVLKMSIFKLIYTVW